MLKLGTGTGNLWNHVASRYVDPEPKVGMGVTFLYWTDRGAGTIMEVKSPRRIVVTEDISTRTDSNGMSESQNYKYDVNPKAPRQIFTKRKNGAWVKLGDEMNGQRIKLGYRDAYHDYSF